ncbi:hypothetical protein, partial [Stenotrophomonas maltophilia]|uniref:hypothetical protein n=1 Tax=Stenotrophomonas maltophilia TaxID=40324 RepID=UPI003CCFE718
MHGVDAARLQLAFDLGLAGGAVLDLVFRVVLPGGYVRGVGARVMGVLVAEIERRLMGGLTDLSERYL